ncbi:hypothetical protein CP965_13220 [Halarcobacter mediterraneus]|uniref:Sensory/regulatory protein RpfC n=1 Tax=Halarcobacter mediterraneus TaxID=2023153 RepID=A0A4Q1AQN4_9BACT|nr:ATP-binding protein [Halarcobacter mediterraneus]RXK11723.1 hypothetical protein CP965_13220 [Halarcobacter mediterraneus]
MVKVKRLLLNKTVYIISIILIILLSILFINFNQTIIKSTEKTKNKLEQIEDISKIDTLASFIANSSVIYLSNLAIEDLKEKILLDFQNRFIEAIVIKDNYLNENLLIAHRTENNKILFVKKLPKKYFKYYNSIKKDIIENKTYTKNKLGTITIYYKSFNTYGNLINLTQKEKDYLKEKKILYTCIHPNWMPLGKLEEDKHLGISSDIVKLISNELNINIELIETKTWGDSLDLLRNKKCDFSPLTTENRLKKEYLNFTKEYLNLNIVVATRPNVPFFDNLKHLKEEKFAVIKNYSLLKDLKEQYPKIDFIEVNSLKEGLKKVKQEKVFGYIDNSLVINHAIQKEYLDDIFISGKLKGEMKLAIATRKELLILNGIFEKLVLNLNEDIKQNIFNKWIVNNYQIKTDYTLVWQLMIVSLFIIFITLYWNRKLSNLNKQLEEQRNHAYEASKAKAKFLANMSHEIRTPMNAIINISHLLLESNLKKQQYEYTKKIEKSANSLLRIINDILDFSKIEAGKIEFKYDVFSLRELINDCIDSIDSFLDKKNLEFSLEYDSNLNEYYYGDKLRISQVLINILHNAVKFTNTGYVKLKVQQKDKNHLNFEIEDSGIGLTKKEQKNIFNSFVQGDSSSSKKYKGTGLGLAITKELIQLMDGKISIKSKKDKGTTFSFFIKLKKSTKEECFNPIIKKPDFTNKKILLVEDNKINQQIITALLKGTKAQVRIAFCGQEAIDIIKEKSSFNLILMDIQMPDLDGYETTKKIRQINKEIPIIAITANSFEEDIEKAINSGMDAHLKKPIEIQKLYATLEKYI